MTQIQQLKDAETLRQTRNQTQMQQKNTYNSREGVIVNSMIKDPKCQSLDDMYDTLLISQNMSLPGELTEKKSEKNRFEKAMLPLSLLTTGLFATMLGATGVIRYVAKQKTKLPAWKTLPEVPRNIALNNEAHFATYVALQNPSTRTIIGALGVFVLGAAGFIMKNFIDGAKDIWVKKQEAKVQRNLQESLIAVEARTFSGKMQTLRTMLSEKAKELDEILHEQISPAKASFRSFMNFKAAENSEKSGQMKESDIPYYTLLGVTALSTIGLTFFALKNLKKTALHYKDFQKSMETRVLSLIESSETVSVDEQETIKRILVTIDPPKPYLEKIFEAVKGKVSLEEFERFKEKTNIAVSEITQRAAEAMAGTPGHKASFYSHTDDPRAYFYNWVVNFDSPILAALFFGVSAVTSIGYIGKQAVEALRQAKVIKANAETELSLQKELVSVEMKNFYVKKSSVIEPLINEFKLQSLNGKDKKELKVMAENILYEIKNGPPFVYS